MIDQSLKDVPAEKRLFVKRLRDKLAEKAMSQRKLSQLACVTSGSISDYLNGKRIPRAAELARLARALGVSMDWLWGENDEGSELNSINHQIVELESYLHRVSTTCKQLAKDADKLRKSE